MDCTIVFEKLWDAMESGKYRYIRLIGGARSSKTFSILQAIYLYCLRKKSKRVSIFRATKENCRATVGNDANLYYKTLHHHRKHETTFTYSFKSNSFIEFTGTDDTDKTHGYNTSISWLNEPYDIPESVFTELDKRADELVIIDANPKEDHWSDKLSLREDCYTIECTFEDNPFCPERQRLTILGYKPISHCHIAKSLRCIDLVKKKKIHVTQAVKKIIESGDYTEKEYIDYLMCVQNEKQGSANEYQWLVYGEGRKADRPNRIFKWKACTFEEYKNIDATEYLGVDWGVSDPFAIVGCKYKDGCLYTHEYNYLSENEWLMLLAQSGRKLDPEGGGVADMILTNYNFPKSRIEIICDSARKDRVMQLRGAGWDCAISVGHKEGVVDSVSSLSQLNVFFTSQSKNIYNEQESYERETDRYGIVLETPVDKNNHLIDAIRYVVTYLKRKGIIKLV